MHDSRRAAARANTAGRSPKALQGRRRLARSCFERTTLAEAKLSPLMRVLRTQVVGMFKVSYLLDFLDLSPALVARYETQMIPKAVLQLKLHEWGQMLQADGVADEDEA